jgi:hypothetical protein
MFKTFIVGFLGAYNAPYRFVLMETLLRGLTSRGVLQYAPTNHHGHFNTLAKCFAIIAILLSTFFSFAQEKRITRIIDLNTFKATVAYIEDTNNITNPERGFRFNAEIGPESNFATYYEALGITLVHSYVRLDDYRDRDLPQEFLDDLETGFTNMRGSGIKTVLRFSYNFGPYPDTEPDAGKTQILRHIEQLKPLLQKNADVIAWMQAGFIGAWGEWHTSTNGLDNVQDKQEILSALLDALPTSRMVQVRYPSDIIEMFPEVLSTEQAFDETHHARVGFHNDCFLSSDTDVGTYEKSGQLTIERDQNYLAELTRFTPAGGETCAPYPPRTDCEIALREMELLHFTELNQSYHPQIIRVWKRQGCLGEIQNRLGYRLVLKSAEVGLRVTPGGVLNLTVNLENQGFASLINPRELIIVLDGPERHELKLPLDPRAWESGEHTFSLSLQLPSALPDGVYRLALWLPDAYQSLRDNPRYAVRFANEGVWNEEKAYNVLVDIKVESTTPGETNNTIERLELISIQ